MGTKRGDGAKHDPHGWWKVREDGKPRKLEHPTPDGDPVPYPDRPCLCGGVGLTIPGAPCGQGFEASSAGCMHCAREQIGTLMLWAYGSDVLKAEATGDTFYNE